MDNPEAHNSSPADGLILAPAAADIVVLEDMLLWRESCELRRVRVQAKILDDFVAIGQRSEPEVVLRFARRWGPLHLCACGVPMFHNRQYADVLTTGGCEELPAGVPDWQYKEPLYQWEHLAKQARAIVAVREKLRGSARDITSAELNDLAYFTSMKGFERMGAWTHDKLAGNHQAANPGRSSLERHVTTSERHQNRRRAAGRLLEMWATKWFQWGAVRPYAQWTGQGFRMAHTSGQFLTTAGAIALQLALELIRTQGTSRNAVFTCSWCGEMFSPKHRRPKANQSIYCPTCRTSPERWREVKRQQRARYREIAPARRGK